MVFGGKGEFGCDELETAFLESGEDLADETTINTVRLFGMFGGWVRRTRRGGEDTLTMM